MGQLRLTPVADPIDVPRELRAAILRGEYAPRQRLIETELAEQYGTSRFVIRNTLAQLANEGLIEIQPNRGARVREVSVQEALEITEIRRAVEGLVAARAAERTNDEECRELRALADAMTVAVQNSDMMRYSDLNATFHSRLRSIAQHRLASRIIEQLNAQMVRHQFMLSLVPGRAAISLPEHIAIIDAVCAGDPVAAEQAMRSHLDSVLDALSSVAESAARVPQFGASALPEGL
jgi:DNA-binding GntR family transcriptional regulator